MTNSVNLASFLPVAQPVLNNLRDVMRFIPYHVAFSGQAKL